MTSSSDHREDMTSLVDAVEERLAAIKAKLNEGESVQKSDLEPLGEDIAQLFVNISVIASWE